MDEHKANMIHSWVENQSANENSVFLTQFKQASDSGDENSDKHKVIVHQEHQSEVQTPTSRTKPKPPPPPPRRTPPRETTPAPLTPPALPVPMIEDAEIIEVQELKDPVATSEISCQVDEMELKANLPEPGPHPLRILSEENLTIVSSFAGSSEKLADLDELRNDEIDPSKLSFFQVPDFKIQEANQDIIAQTFKDFKTMHQTQAQPQLQACSSFQDPRYDIKENQNLKTFSSTSSSSCSSNNNLLALPGGANPTIPKCELITPQKQFLLLSQSLRHPDGSSNPELNVVQGEKVLESEAKRSPGNGKSDTEGNYLPTFYDKSFLAELLTAILDNSVGVKFDFSKISALGNCNYEKIRISKPLKFVKNTFRGS